MAVEYYPRRNISRPNTQIRIDSSAVTGSAVASRKPVMVVGPAVDGKPDTVYRIRNMYDAQQVFRGGELLDALELLWNPSAETPGAGDVLAMRVENASPAVYNASDVVFSSLLFGEHANEIQISLQTEDINGASRVFTIDYAPDNYHEEFYDVGVVGTLSKSDDENAPAYIGVEIKDNELIINSGESAEASQQVKFPLGTGNFAYSAPLLNELSLIPGLQVEQPITRNKNINTADIDDMELTEITADESVELTAFLADLVDLLEYNAYVEVDKDSLIEVQDGADIADFELVNLEGGTDGVAPTSWASKFERFANEGGYYLVPLTDSDSVHKEASAFVNERYAVGDPMRAIVGSGYNEATQQLLRRASALRNPRTMLVGASGKNTFQDGRVVEVPGYLYAAEVAGLASGLDVGQAVTFKQINVNELATVNTPTELDALNSGGVVMFQLVRDGSSKKFRVVDDVTTYNDPNNPVANQMAVGEASDFLVSELKITLDENFIGSKVVNLSASLIKNHVQSFLDQKKRNNEIQDYNPEDVQVILEGETARISMVIYPVRTLKEINVNLVYKTQVIES